MKKSDSVSVAYSKPKDDSSCSYCAAPKALQTCGRCARTKYCNKECQTKHWKEGHKQVCRPYKEESGPEPIAAYANQTDRTRMKKVLREAKSGITDEGDQICSTCKKVSKCINKGETPMEGGGASACASFVCGSGHLHAVSDVRFSLVQECTCKIEKRSIQSFLSPEQSRMFKQMVAPVRRLLILTGFNLFHTSNALYYTKLTPLLAVAGIPFDVILADNGDILTKSLHTNKYSHLMFIHLDEKGLHKNVRMFEGQNYAVLYHWIKAGGRFTMHGEGPTAMFVLQDFVGKPWHQCGDFYRRIKHSCNRRHFRHFSLLASAENLAAVAADEDSDEEDADTPAGGGGQPLQSYLLPKTINMKATTLCGVAEEDRLYNPKPGARCISAVPGFGGHIVNHERTGVAFSPVGDGSVCYIGDVNAEVKTLEMIIALLRLP